MDKARINYYIENEMTLKNMLSTKEPNGIPVHNLEMDVELGEREYCKEIMQGEIEGLTIFHKACTSGQTFQLDLKTEQATFILILKGSGVLLSDKSEQHLEAESIVLLPHNSDRATITTADSGAIHFLEFTKKYSSADKENLELQEHQSNELYYTRYQDCTPYTEKIKSPNTISRTILPGGMIPRVALGTVEAVGPDEVGAHSHPMLEQLFLGLSDNAITVYADDAHAEIRAYSLLHIPLGSTHWVEVAERCKMNYMWMDFFLTKEGEVWLDTHKHIAEKGPSQNI